MELQLSKWKINQMVNYLNAKSTAQLEYFVNKCIVYFVQHVIFNNIIMTTEPTAYRTKWCQACHFVSKHMPLQSII